MQVGLAFNLWLYVPYIWLPKYKDYSKIAKTVFTQGPEVSKLRLSYFVDIYIELSEVTSDDILILIRQL